MPSPRRVARGLTQPMRDYFNQHFEATKEEIRAAAANGVTTGTSAGGAAVVEGSVAELSSILAETALHQSTIVAQLRDEVGALERQVGEMSTRLDELTAV
ncbi:MAG: hypothetical protein AAFP84_18305, partial [Actinomycetota bacterium]